MNINNQGVSYSDQNIDIYSCSTVGKLVLTIFNEGTYLTLKSIFNKALDLVEFDCEITLESVPGTYQY